MDTTFQPMQYESRDFVDWDGEVDPFPQVEFEWDIGERERQALDELLANDFVVQDYDKETARKYGVTKSSFDGDTKSTQGSESLTETDPGIEIFSNDDEMGNDLESRNGSKKATSGRGRGRIKGSGRTANETEDERKERLAAACRRFRARRKEEINVLKRKNDDLEQERELYLNKIAELQTEAQFLRDHGTADIVKENELLRVEIRKHKKFIQTIVSAARNAPLVTDEEKYRLLCSGVSSAVGQALGICYTSVIDPSWKEALPQFISEQEVIVRFQYLPIGATGKDRKRLNLRIDFPNIPLSCDELAQRLWASWLDDNMLKEIFRGYFMEQVNKCGLQDIDMQEVFPELHCDPSFNWEKENIRVFRFEEKFADLKSQDLLSATALKDCSIAPAAFPSPVELHDGSQFPHLSLVQGPLPAKVVVCASSRAIQEHSEHFCPRREGVDRIDSPVIEGFVSVPMEDPNMSHLLYASSFPVSTLGVFGFNDGRSPVINEDGTLSELAEKLCGTILHFVMHSDSHPGSPVHPSTPE